MSLNTFLIATDGIGGGSPTTIATFGFGPFVAVTVLDPPPGMRGGGGRIDSPKAKKSETILVRYKGKTVAFDPDKDKDKKLVHIRIGLPRGQSASHMMLVDAKKATIMIRASAIANSFAERVVRVFGLKRKQNTPDVRGEMLDDKYQL